MISLGLSLFGTLSITKMTELSREAEQRGFESVWVVEGTGSDAFASIAAIIEHTSRIIIGTAIVGIYTRHPCVLASASASLDEASRGRFRLGLGASHPEIVQNQLGLRYAKPVRRMEETIEIIRKIQSSSAPVNFRGEIFCISNFSLWFNSFRPRLDIYLAANGPRMIELLAKHADGSLLFLKTEDNLKKSIQMISELSRKWKRKQCPNIGFIVPCAIHEDESSAISAAKMTLAQYVMDYEAYRKSLSEQGFGREVKAIMTETRPGLDKATEQITDEMVRSLTVLGTKGEEIMKDVACFERCGVDLLILEPCAFKGERFEDTMSRTIRLLR